MGAEMVARGQGAELSSVSGAARWTSDKHSLSATLGNRGLDLCYARVVRPYLTIATLLEVSYKLITQSLICIFLIYCSMYILCV